MKLDCINIAHCTKLNAMQKWRNGFKGGLTKRKGHLKFPQSISTLSRQPIEFFLN